MRFFLDHDVPADLALLLRSRGHEAVRLSEVLPPDTYPGLIILNRRRSRQLETSRLLMLLKNAG